MNDDFFKRRPPRDNPGLELLRDITTERDILADRVAELEATMTSWHRDCENAAKSYPGIPGESFSATEAVAWYENQLAAERATLAACKKEGFLDENGNVRKVLGTLPVTADGYVVGIYDGWLYKPQYPKYKWMAPSVFIFYNGDRDTGVGQVRCDDLYSTRSAAEKARGE
jgi:hypothetical protein